MITLMGEKQVDIRFIHAGLFTTEDEWIHPAIAVGNYELIYVISGIVYLEEDGIKTELREGDIFLLSPNLLHKGYQKSCGKTSFYWAHFIISDLSLFGLKAGYMKASDSYRISSLLKRLLHAANTYTYPENTTDIITALILAELYSSQSILNSPSAELVNKICEWIRINNNKKISAAKVAAQFRYHPDYISSIFKKNLGKQLKQYIDEERIKYAKHLLLTTTMSVKEVSVHMGWENENTFIHYFKYHEEISPAKYRNMYYNTHMNSK